MEKLFDAISKSNNLPLIPKDLMKEIARKTRLGYSLEETLELYPAILKLYLEMKKYALQNPIVKLDMQIIYDKTVFPITQNEEYSSSFRREDYKYDPEVLKFHKLYYHKIENLVNKSDWKHEDDVTTDWYEYNFAIGRSIFEPIYEVDYPGLAKIAKVKSFSKEIVLPRLGDWRFGYKNVYSAELVLPLKIAKQPRMAEEEFFNFL
jgi:hypothetical protein